MSSTPAVVIRAVAESDHLELAELFYEFYTVFNMEQTLKGVVKDLLRVDDAKKFSLDSTREYTSSEYITFVAEAENKLVGYITGTINQKEHYIYSSEAEIVDWFVTDSFRGKGIGKKLYESYLDKVRTLGAQSVSVEAFSDNTETIRTYQNLGFVNDSVILKKIL